jgi:hypothetical protein
LNWARATRPALLRVLRLVRSLLMFFMPISDRATQSLNQILTHNFHQNRIPPFISVGDSVLAIPANLSTSVPSIRSTLFKLFPITARIWLSSVGLWKLSLRQKTFFCCPIILWRRLLHSSVRGCTAIRRQPTVRQRLLGRTCRPRFLVFHLTMWSPQFWTYR